MKASRSSFPFLGLHTPWRNNANDIWIASSLGLHRNFSRFPFPHKMSAEERQQILETTSQNLLSQKEFNSPYFTKVDTVGPFEKEFLLEHFMIRHTFQQSLGGEGFILDNTGSIFAMINLEDHLQLQLTDIDDELESAWERLVAIENDLSQTLSYAYSSRFGYLTANPINSGTGLIVRAFLHLPGLIATDQLSSLKTPEILMQSVSGPLEEVTGDLVVIRNQCAIGLTEEQILQTVRTAAIKLTVAEKRVRTTLRDSNNPEIKDRISRAIGLLQHSYQIETPEAWDALSMMKLGIDLGWVEGVTHAELNELMISCRRAHLVSEYNDDISLEELPHRRTEFLHNCLSKVHTVGL